MGLRIGITISIVTIIFLVVYMIAEPFSYIEKPPAEGIDFVNLEEKDQDCSKYIDFMKQPVNQDYYKYPLFLNPRESCQQQCQSGIWFDGKNFGTKGCCRKACDVIKKGDFE